MSKDTHKMDGQYKKNGTRLLKQEGFLKVYSPREHKRTSSGTQPGNARKHNGSRETLYFKLALPSNTLVAF